MPRTPRSTTIARVGLLAGLLAALLGACGHKERSDRSVAANADGGSTEIVVLAAASLTEVFTEIGGAFSDAHPELRATFGFGASSELVTQITQGAPADVFASADGANMTKLTTAGLVAGAPVVFATNELQIIVAPGNPKRITTVADLAQPGLVVVTCSPDVPIGRYSAQVLANAGVAVTPKSWEANVKGIVTKVISGEADAGIVYATDVRAAGTRAEGIPIPPEIGVVVEYPIAVTRDAPHPEAAQAFVDFVTSANGQRILQTYGFGTR